MKSWWISFEIRTWKSDIDQFRLQTVECQPPAPPQKRQPADVYQPAEDHLLTARNAGAQEDHLATFSRKTMGKSSGMVHFLQKNHWTNNFWKLYDYKTLGFSWWFKRIQTTITRSSWEHVGQWQNLPCDSWSSCWAISLSYLIKMDIKERIEFVGNYLQVN